MKHFLFLLVIIFLNHETKAQLTVTQIDSICTSIDLGLYSTCSISCGSITSRENCYLAKDENTLLSSSGFYFARDTSFLYDYHYFNGKPIKAILSLKNSAGVNTYSATYYFDNNKVIKIIGEDENICDTISAFQFATAHTYWFPKKRKTGFQ